MAMKVRDILPGKLYWDGKDNNRKFCKGGVYIYKIETNKENFYGSVVLVK